MSPIGPSKPQFVKVNSFALHDIHSDTLSESSVGSKLQAAAAPSAFAAAPSGVDEVEDDPVPPRAVVSRLESVKSWLAESPAPGQAEGCPSVRTSSEIISEQRLPLVDAANVDTFAPDDCHTESSAASLGRRGQGGAATVPTVVGMPEAKAAAVVGYALTDIHSDTMSESSAGSRAMRSHGRAAAAPSNLGPPPPGLSAVAPSVLSSLTPGQNAAAASTGSMPAAAAASSDSGSTAAAKAPAPTATISGSSHAASVSTSDSHQVVAQ